VPGLAENRMEKKRSQRRHETERVAKKRLAEARNLGAGGFGKAWWAKAPGVAKNHHPVSCRRSRCLVCHYEKLMSIPTRAEIKAKLDQHEQSEESD
jgi:hypothetical protein